MRIEIEKVFDVADLFTPKGKTIIFPVSPVYIASAITEALETVSPGARYSVRWTGKRFAAHGGEAPLFHKDFSSKDEMREKLPNFYGALGMLNRARLTCNQGQLPVTSI